MKKHIALLLLLVMTAALSFAGAGNDDAVVQMAQSLLTEVYGYTQEEADAFTYDISDENDVWVVRFYQNPEWVYKAWINKSSMDFAGYSSPFTTLYRGTASENSVRYVLRAIAENGWFDSWDDSGKAALVEVIEWCGDIRMNASMERGLLSDAYTPAQALDDLFLSCYDETAQWSTEIVQWRDAVFASFGLTRDTVISAAPQGIVTYVVGKTNTCDGTTICEFTGEAPEALSQAFSHAKLEGWECLAGAYQELNRTAETDTPAGTGLAAFGRGDERLLVMLVQDSKTLEWEVLPVSETALLPDREFYISYGGSTSRFDIVYPISDTETEAFCCRIMYYTNKPDYTLMCALEEYRYINRSENSQLVIDPATNYSYAAWYHVVKTQNGIQEEAQYPALCAGVMEYIDASAFPRTEEECREASENSATVPEGYGFSGSVHLRAKASSHSDDLGTYRSGTLVEVLDTQPGTDFPWYHVRIGIAEGYMSGNYVTYSDSEQIVPRYAVLGMGELTEDTALKEGTGIFAGKIADLPRGTIVRVLAERGNWLHVSIPLDEDDWMMQPGEVNGYVKSSVLTQAATALQLEWLAEE